MLPICGTTDQYKTVNAKDPVFATVAQLIVKNLNIESIDSSFPSNGSLPVVFIGDVAIKFFPAAFPDAFENERGGLHFLKSSQAPRLLSSGDIFGWKYIAMTKFNGQSLKDLWPQLSKSEQELTCHKIGKSLRQIHELKIESSGFDLNGWSSFLTEQKTACYSRHKKMELREDLLAQIPSFIESIDLHWNQLSFLHTEVMRDHVFFEKTHDSVSMEGFIDFEPSMIGAREYDFASVALFVASGERYALRAFFEGYGNLEEASNKDFRRRIMAYILLHRYSNMKWYLQFMPNINSLDEMADSWVGI